MSFCRIFHTTETCSNSTSHCIFQRNFTFYLAPAATSTAWLVNVSAASTDSVSRSKHTMESMMPPANDSSRLTVRFDSLLNSAPTMPPNPVPPAPATSVTTVMNTNGSMIPLYP